MRTSGLPNFRKLWGKVEQKSLQPGKYYFLVANTYDVSAFSGEKSFVISTSNSLGGKNYFMAYSYLAVGGCCILFAIVFLIAYIKKSFSQ
jgi:hypothetical protein